MGNVVGLYPDSFVFGAIGTHELGGSGVDLTIAVNPDGIVIWAEAPVLSVRFAQVAAIGVDEGALDVAAVVSGKTVRYSIPLAAPAEAAHIADRVLMSLAGRTA